MKLFDFELIHPHNNKLQSFLKEISKEQADQIELQAVRDVMDSIQDFAQSFTEDEESTQVDEDAPISIINTTTVNEKPGSSLIAQAAKTNQEDSLEIPFFNDNAPVESDEDHVFEDLVSVAPNLELFAPDTKEDEMTVDEEIFNMFLAKIQSEEETDAQPEMSTQDFRDEIAKFVSADDDDDFVHALKSPEVSDQDDDDDGNEDADDDDDVAPAPSDLKKKKQQRKKDKTPITLRELPDFGTRPKGALKSFIGKTNLKSTLVYYKVRLVHMRILKEITCMDEAEQQNHGVTVLSNGIRMSFSFIIGTLWGICQEYCVAPKNKWNWTTSFLSDANEWPNVPTSTKRQLLNRVFEILSIYTLLGYTVDQHSMEGSVIVNIPASQLTCREFASIDSGHYVIAAALLREYPGTGLKGYQMELKDLCSWFRVLKAGETYDMEEYEHRLSSICRSLEIFVSADKLAVLNLKLMELYK